MKQRSWGRTDCALERPVLAMRMRGLEIREETGVAARASHEMRRNNVGLVRRTRLRRILIATSYCETAAPLAGVFVLAPELWPTSIC
jgi:hypothetical protein